MQWSEDAPPIPVEVWAAVHTELSKNRTLAANQVKATPIEKILKKLGCSTEIQNCAARIANRFSGQPSPQFSRSECAQLSSNFADFKSVFLRIKRSSKCRLYLSLASCLLLISALLCLRWRGTNRQLSQSVLLHASILCHQWMA